MSIRNEIVDKLSGDNRKDITLREAIKVGASFKLAFSFNKKIGNPTYKNLQKVFAEYLPELKPEMCSATRVDNVVFIFASTNNETKPLSAKKSMTPVVAGLSFLDQDLGEYWSVHKDDKGEVVLQKTIKLDVHELVSERARRMGDVVQAGVSIHAAVHNLAVGDTVKIYHDNKPDVGLVKKMSKAGMVTFESNTGEVKEIDADYVIQILKNSPDKTKEMKKTAKEYFAVLYGNDFARKMTK